MNIMWQFVRVMLVMGAASAACHLEAAESEITRFTRGGPDVTQPKSSTDNRKASYGLGYLVQVDSRKAALFCNLRIVEPGFGDYEDGGDVFVFDDLNNIAKGGPMPVTRIEKEKDGKTGEPRFILKFPPCPGFWPLGAKRPDGTAHPGAGKGFAFCQALSLIGTGEKLTGDMYKTLNRYVEVMRLAFNGRQVSVVERRLIKPGQDWVTTNGWSVFSPGLQPAIPDGDDLLLALTASSKKGGQQTGVCRFRFLEGQWRPVFFTPVIGEDETGIARSACEPSLARRADGSFIFTARTFGKNSASESIELWAAKEADGPWAQHLRADNERCQAPVSVHATTDGKIFILSNPPGITSLDGKVKWADRKRVQLALWQLAEGKAGFNPPRPRLVRDGPQEFGRFDGHRWVIDHPVSAVVQLGDRLWHCVVAYRVITSPAAKTPHHGCYVEEVITAQPATPPWRF